MSLTAPTAEDIRAFRQSVGLTQAGLAEALGMSKRGVEDWEGGRREAPAYLLLAFSALRANLGPWSTAGSVPDPAALPDVRQKAPIPPKPVRLGLQLGPPPSAPGSRLKTPKVKR